MRSRSVSDAQSGRPLARRPRRGARAGRRVDRRRGRPCGGSPPECAPSREVARRRRRPRPRGAASPRGETECPPGKSLTEPRRRSDAAADPGVEERGAHAPRSCPRCRTSIADVSLGDDVEADLVAVGLEAPRLDVARPTARAAPRRRSARPGRRSRAAGRPAAASAGRPRPRVTSTGPRPSRISSTSKRTRPEGSSPAQAEPPDRRGGGRRAERDLARQLRPSGDRSGPPRTATPRRATTTSRAPSSRTTYGAFSAVRQAGQLATSPCRRRRPWKIGSVRLEVEALDVENAAVARLHDHRDAPFARRLADEELHVERVALLDDEVEPVEEPVEVLRRAPRRCRR